MHRISRTVLALLLISPLALAGCGGGTAETPAAKNQKKVTPEELLQGQWHGQMVLATTLKGV